MNYYERYCGDYARDTAHLSLQEHGVYTVMLDTYYATEAPLPSDLKALYRICRAMTASERHAVEKIAEEFFPVFEDGLRHNWKADEVIAKAQKRIAAAKTNGAKHQPNGIPRPEPTGLPSRSIGTSTNSSPKEKTKPPFELPDWVNSIDWTAFEEHRKKLRKPLTDFAKRLVVKELDRLRADGHEPGAVLQQSVRRGWLDVFPVKDAPQKQGLAL